MKGAYICVECQMAIEIAATDDALDIGEGPTLVFQVKFAGDRVGGKLRQGDA